MILSCNIIGKILYCCNTFKFREINYKHYLDIKDNIHIGTLMLKCSLKNVLSCHGIDQL